MTKKSVFEIKLIPFFGKQLYQKYNLGILRILIVVYYLIILATVVGLTYGVYDYQTKKSNYEKEQYKVTKYQDMDVSFRENLKVFAELDIQRTEKDLMFASLGVVIVLLLYWVVLYLLGWIFSGFFTKKEQ